MTFVPGPYKWQSASPIQLDTVLVVEGRDTFEFALALLVKLGLQNRIEVRDGGGVAKKGTGDFEQYIRLLPSIAGFNQVSSLGILRDADANPGQAFQDVCKALRKAQLPVPQTALLTSAPTPKVTVMLLPDPQSPGMLETLCWRALNNDSRIPCVEEFLTCIEKVTGQPLAYTEKSRIQAYIAAREEPRFLLGQAARSDYFPWDSSHFAEVKQFLQLLASKP